MFPAIVEGKLAHFRIYHNMKTNKKIYIIGIGGISLSALAVLLQDKGAWVKGSDLSHNSQVDELLQKGFDIVIGHSTAFVLWADEIILSAAVPENDCDVEFAKKLGKKIITRAEALGWLSSQYRTISVSGCHGKTTTTGMISTILLDANKKPNIHIGGILNQIKSNVCEGESDILVTEACEYKDSFLSLSSEIGVILNVKPDHLDYFLNFDNVKRSFNKFAQNVNPNGTLVLNADDETCQKIMKSPFIQCKMLSFGILSPCDIQATNIYEYENGKFAFLCKLSGEQVEFHLPVYGYHNIYNALASIAVCVQFGLTPLQVQQGIENFKGISRRFEKVFEDKNKIVIHDYAHHPDEIKASIQAGRKLKKDKIIAIFQPHTFSRTKDFFDEFCQSLMLADEVWLLPIYPAREKPIKDISSYKIYKNIKKNNKKTRYFKDFYSIYKKIKNLQEDCLVLILGAGDIEDLARMLQG